MFLKQVHEINLVRSSNNVNVHTDALWEDVFRIFGKVNDVHAGPLCEHST